MSPILSTFMQKIARQAQISILVAIDGYPKTEMRCHWDDKKNRLYNMQDVQTRIHARIAETAKPYRKSQINSMYCLSRKIRSISL